MDAKDDWRILANAQELSRLITTLNVSGLSEMTLLEAGKTTAVIRKPKLPGRPGNMFVLSEKTRKKDGGHDDGDNHAPTPGHKKAKRKP